MRMPTRHRCVSAVARPRIIVLVGLMGSGKSAVARRLSGEGIAVLDTDRIVERDAGRTVREIFAEEGEEGFRVREEAAVRECLATAETAVMAAAGGVVTRDANREALRDARDRGVAWVVWLHTDPDELAVRVSRGGHRPLLDDDPAGTLRRLDSERGPMYRAVADVVVDTTGHSLDEVAESVRTEFAARFGEWGPGHV